MENSKGLVAGWYERPRNTYRTPNLRRYLQNSIVVTKIHKVVEYQQKCCFKGLAKDVMEDANPDLNIIAETKDTGTLAMGHYVWTKVSTQTWITIKDM